MAETKEKKELNFYQRLNKVREELKAPKSQYNSFGKYNYRNCEDILEAAKPLCAKHEIFLEIHDELIEFQEKPCFKVEALAIDTQNTAYMTKAAGYAFIDETKKGMDAAQICGSASSYARKYALNALFHCDDSRDIDSDAYAQAGQTAKPKQQATSAKKAQDEGKKLLSKDGVIQLLDFLSKNGVEEQTILTAYKIKSLTELTQIQGKAICKNLDKFLARQKAEQTGEAQAEQEVSDGN